MLKLCIPIGAIIFCACNTHVNTEKTGGTLEASEVTVSAETTGKILVFPVEEGHYLNKDSIVGIIDTISIYRQLCGMISMLKATEKKTKSITTEQGILKAQFQAQHEQIKVLQAELDGMLVDQQRFGNLVKADAVPTKQLDDIQAAIAVLRAKLNAAKSALQVTAKRMEANIENSSQYNASIKAECEKIQQDVRSMYDNIKRCFILNPISGRVLYKYVNVSEYVSPGKHLYTIADLHNLYLRCYLSPEQRAKVKLGQTVSVNVEHLNQGKIYTGKVEWISDVAEFTPKQAQTPEERAIQVFAVKVAITNEDEALKIGMYGNVSF